MNRREEIVRKVDSLPHLPRVAAEVARLVRDPDTELDALVGVLERDQGLTARILKLANSAHYGFPRRIHSLRQAVIVLGFHAIRDLVLAATTHTFMDREMDGYGLERGGLWEHAIACAAASRILSETTGYCDRDRAFTAGLIHDIGKVVLDYHVGEEYGRILAQVRERGRSFARAEEEILGFNHAEIGAQVADRWNLPHDLVGVIRVHHDPFGTAGEGRDLELEAIVHTADVLCHMLGFGLGSDGMLYTFDGRALEILGLDEDSVEDIYARVGDLAVEIDAPTL